MELGEDPEVPLEEAFEPAGVVAVVGAGGKKSTLFALAGELGQTVVTATVRIPPFEGQVERLVVTDEPVSALEDNTVWPLGLTPGREEGRDRYLGYDTGTVDDLGEAADVPVLVKADGARTRWLKAPAEDEPQVPSSSSVVVPVASVKAVGEPLSEQRVHRPERVADLADVDVGEPLTPQTVVTVLTHTEGGLKNVPADARVVPLLNMVDDPGLESTARAIADQLVEHPRIDRVVLGRMDRERAIDVVERADG